MLRYATHLYSSVAYSLHANSQRGPGAAQGARSGVRNSRRGGAQRYRPRCQYARGPGPPPPYACRAGRPLTRWGWHRVRGWTDRATWGWSGGGGRGRCHGDSGLYSLSCVSPLSFVSAGQDVVHHSQAFFTLEPLLHHPSRDRGSKIICTARDGLVGWWAWRGEGKGRTWQGGKEAARRRLPRQDRGMAPASTRIL